MNSKNSCMECKKCVAENRRLSKLHLADGVNCFLVTLHENVMETTHVALALSLEKIGIELTNSLLNEQVARRYLDG